jgi:polyhydroxybutyrate depolymerase
MDESLQAADTVRGIVVDGLERSYVVHVPPQYDRATPMSVVLAFHGGASNGDQMARFCGLSEKADAAGFICVYPNGTGRLRHVLTWNGGNCCGYAREHQIDDVRFTGELLDDLEKIAAIDRRRIYATGMSNGAVFCYRLAAELSDRIAAIAPVAGTMGMETCHPARPMPVVHFHGTEDEFCPFDGGRGPKSVSRTDFYSVEHTIRAWVEANGCPAMPVVDRLHSARSDVDDIVIRKTYGPGRNDVEVILYVIQRGGHTWPGRHPRLFFLGRSTRTISANDEIWSFFQRYSL